MNLPNEHLFKGIGWYLHNGVILDTRLEDFFFVGRLEYFSQDYSSLLEKLQIKNPSLPTKDRIHFRKVDSSSKCSLSPEARSNIIKWYEPTDYSALNSLQIHNFITKKDLDFYYS